MATRRVNLCFNLNNKKSQKAYDYIKEQSAKTAYVTEAVIYYAENQNKIDKSVIKEAIREVFDEYDVGNNMSIDSNSKNENKKEGTRIPDDIFDLIIDM